MWVWAHDWRAVARETSIAPELDGLLNRSWKFKCLLTIKGTCTWQREDTTGTQRALSSDSDMCHVTLSLWSFYVLWDLLYSFLLNSISLFWASLHLFSLFSEFSFCSVIISSYWSLHLFLCASVPISLSLSFPHSSFLPARVVCTCLQTATIKTHTHTSMWLYQCNVLLQACLQVTNWLLELNRVAFPPSPDISSTESITHAVSLLLPQLRFWISHENYSPLFTLYFVRILKTMQWMRCRNIASKVRPICRLNNHCKVAVWIYLYLVVADSRGTAS
jgi:hypothetical protein